MHITWHADDIRAGRRVVSAIHKHEFIIVAGDRFGVLLLVDLTNGQTVMSHTCVTDMALTLTHMQAHPKELHP